MAPEGKFSNETSAIANLFDSSGTRTEQMKLAPQQKPSKTNSSGCLS